MRHFILSLLAGFVGAFLFTMVNQFLPSASADGPQVISARAFNLVDSNGKLRGQFAVAPQGGPGFWLMDDSGTARISLGVYPDNTGYMGLQDKSGNMIQLMRSYGPKEAPLLIFKNSGRDMMIMGLNPANDPVPFLMSYDNSRSRKLHFGRYEGP